VPAIGGISARRPPVIGLGLEDAPPPDPNVDVESLYEDDRVKVLRKHLVSREERHNGSDGVPSRKASTANLAIDFQEDSNAFPVPYHTPGADITYVDTFDVGAAIPFLKALRYSLSLSFPPPSHPIGMVYTSGNRNRVDLRVHVEYHLRALLE
jgi:hypothetical protein